MMNFRTASLFLPLLLSLTACDNDKGGESNFETEVSDATFDADPVTPPVKDPVVTPIKLPPVIGEPIKLPPVIDAEKVADAAYDAVAPKDKTIDDPNVYDTTITGQIKLEAIDETPSAKRHKMTLNGKTVGSLPAPAISSLMARTPKILMRRTRRRRFSILPIRGTICHARTGP